MTYQILGGHEVSAPGRCRGGGGGGGQKVSDPGRS